MKEGKETTRKSRVPRDLESGLISHGIFLRSAERTAKFHPLVSVAYRPANFSIYSRNSRRLKYTFQPTYVASMFARPPAPPCASHFYLYPSRLTFSPMTKTRIEWYFFFSIRHVPANTAAVLLNSVSTL